MVRDKDKGIGHAGQRPCSDVYSLSLGTIIAVTATSDAS